MFYKAGRYCVKLWIEREREREMLGSHGITVRLPHLKLVLVVVFIIFENVVVVVVVNDDDDVAGVVVVIII